MTTENQASYEALYAELESTVARLESGELPLDEALACYERGVALTAACQQLLDAAELRIQQLSNGELTPWRDDDV